MLTRIAWIAIAAACVGGCTEYLGPPSSPDYWKAREQAPVAQADDSEEEESSAEQPKAAPSPAAETDTVIVIQQEEAPRPRARSISLGYMGEGVLAGGMTRDSVVPPKQPYDPYAPTNWQGYVNAPKWRSAGPQFRRTDPYSGYPRTGFGRRAMPFGFAGTVPPCPYGATY